MITEKEDVKQIVKEGVYSRCAVTTACIITKCDGCDKENVPGINVDDSGGEYTEATICFECIEQMKNSVNPV